MSEIPLSSFRTFADGLDHPEGVSRGPNGLVYAGGEAGQVYKVWERFIFSFVGTD